jgi:hypothetical protein
LRLEHLSSMQTSAMDAKGAQVDCSELLSFNIAASSRACIHRFGQPLASYAMWSCRASMLGAMAWRREGFSSRREQLGRILQPS